MLDSSQELKHRTNYCTQSARSPSTS